MGVMGYERKRRRGFFNPRYDELSLSMMSLAFLLVVFFTERLQKVFFMLLEGFKVKDEWPLLIFLLIAAVFLLLPFYHLLTKRKKSGVEKTIMLAFAVLTNAGSGILAGMYILFKSAGANFLFLILPFWNIFICLMLIGLWEKGIINLDSVTDKNARFLEVLLGFIVIVAVFSICQFGFKLYWVFTFSICVICATSFGEAIGAVFNPRTAEQSADVSSTSEEVKELLRPKDAQKCGLCGRVIAEFETPWVVGDRTVVCKECYDKIKREKNKENEKKV